MSIFYANNGNLLDPQKAPLEPGKYPPEIKVGDRLSIRLMCAHLCGMSDGILDIFGGSFPVLAHSSVRIGGRSGVEQIHYYGQGHKNGTFLNFADECYNDIVYSCKSWVGEEVFLELGIYEVDKISEDWMKAIDDIVSVAGSVFLPYVTYIWATGALAKLAISANNKFNKNDEVLTRKIRLVADKSFLHRKLLRPGRYVVINEAENIPGTNPADWILNTENKLVSASDRNPLKVHPYLVFEVMNKIPQGREKFEANQELAHFLQMIKGDKRGPKPSDYADLIRATAKGLITYRYLKDIRTLHDMGASRSDAETEKLKALLENIDITGFEYIAKLKKELLEA